MRALLAVAVVATTLSIPAVPVVGGVPAFAGEKIDISYQASRTRLMSNGYSQVKMVNGNLLQLSAFDPEGSEVILSINPQSGEIDSTTYVHSMDLSMVAATVHSDEPAFGAPSAHGWHWQTDPESYRSDDLSDYSEKFSWAQDQAIARPYPSNAGATSIYMPIVAKSRLQYQNRFWHWQTDPESYRSDDLSDY